MADQDTPKDKTVTLKPGKSAAKPALVPVNTGLKPVVVSVPTAVPVAVSKVTAVPSAHTVTLDDGPVKKGPLLDKVVERSGVKRSDAKNVMEALFSVMAEELLNENDMQLPPLGKLKVVKSKDVGKGATAITIKLRTPNTES